MKRFGKILMVASLAMVSYSASAELAPQWSKGTMMANAELGVQPFGGAVSVDYVLVDEWWKGHFTVGGEFDFRSQNHWGAIGVTPRATYGLNITDQFEVHVAAAMGFGFANYDHDGIEDDDSFILHNEMIGCRFFFNDNIGVIAETGVANWFPVLRAGITIKF